MVYYQYGGSVQLQIGKKIGWCTAEICRIQGIAYSGKILRQRETSKS